MASVAVSALPLILEAVPALIEALKEIDALVHSPHTVQNVEQLAFTLRSALSEVELIWRNMQPVVAEAESIVAVVERDAEAVVHDVQHIEQHLMAYAGKEIAALRRKKEAKK